MKGFLGIFIYVIGLISTTILAYTFRDFSYQLTFLFLLSILSLTTGTIILHSVVEREGLNEVVDDCEVVGKFSL
jgi:sugar phosphate permease